jgi:restriction endonuclease S subunit
VRWGLTKGKFAPRLYSPSVLKFFEQLWRMTGASKMREFIREGAYGVLPPGDSYDDDLPITFLRATEMKPNLKVDLASCHRVAEAYFNPKARANIGDVLLAVKGATIASDKCVALIEDDPGKAIVNGSIFRMRFKESVSPKFAAVVLDTPLLKRQMRLGLVANNGVDYLDKSMIHNLVFPVPSTERQHAIILIYEAAVGSHQSGIKKAEEILASIDDYLLAELGITLPPVPENAIANRIFTAQRRDLAGWRFDPQALHPERETCIKELQRLPSHPLRRAASFCRDLRADIPDGAIYIGLENIESNTGRYVLSSEKESISSAFAFSKGQVLFPKLRPYLNKVFLAQFDGLCSTEFHVLDGITVRSDFLALFLRSQIVVKQTKHLMSGNTLPRLQTDDIEDLLIPEVDDALQKQIVEEAVRRMTESEHLRQQAATELEAAKRRIEAMLLGEEP